MYHDGIQYVLLEEQKMPFYKLFNKSRKAFRRPKCGNLPEHEDEILQHVKGVCVIMV
jgi:hypothetical protein